MKRRRHHNNKGERQIKAGKTRGQVMAMAKRLGIVYCHIDKAQAELDAATKALQDRK